MWTIRSSSGCRSRSEVSARESMPRITTPRRTAGVLVIDRDGSAAWTGTVGQDSRLQQLLADDEALLADALRKIEADFAGLR